MLSHRAEHLISRAEAFSDNSSLLHTAIIQRHDSCSGFSMWSSRTGSVTWTKPWYPTDPPVSSVPWARYWPTDGRTCGRGPTIAGGAEIPPCGTVKKLGQATDRRP